MAADYLKRAEQAPAIVEALNRDADRGSNSWVIGGRHTANGRPILASDPHLGAGQPGAVLPDRARGRRLRRPGRQHPGLAVRHPRPEPGHRVRPDHALRGRDRHVRRAGPRRPGVAERAVHRVRGPARAGRRHRRDVPGQPAHAGAAGRARRRAAGWRDPGADADRPAPQQRAAPHGRPGGGHGRCRCSTPGFSPTDRARRVPADQRRARRRRLPRGAPVLRRRRAELPLRRPQGQHRLLHQRGGADPRGPAGRQGRRQPAVPAARRHRRQRVAPGPATGSRTSRCRTRSCRSARCRRRSTRRPGSSCRRTTIPTGNTFDNDVLNQVRPGGGIFYLGFVHNGFRAGRITDMVRAAVRKGRITAADVATMQADTTSIDGQFFTPVITAALARARQQLHAGAGRAGEGPAHRRGGRPARPVEPHLPDRHPARGTTPPTATAGSAPRRSRRSTTAWPPRSTRCGAAGSPSTCSTSTCSRSRRSCRCPATSRRRRRCGSCCSTSTPVGAWAGPASTSSPCRASPTPPTGATSSC